MQFFGLATALYESALAHHNAGRLQEAEQGYLQALAQDPGHYQALHQLGVLSGQIGQHQRSLEFTDRAIGVDPAVAEAHLNRGYALANLGREAEAEASFRRAQALKPTLGEAQAALDQLARAVAARKAPPQA